LQQRGNCSPHSAAVIFSLAFCSSDAFLSTSIPAKLLLRAAVMGKRSSTVAGAAAGAATKRAKTTDTDGSAVGNWVQTKIGDRELSSAEKIGVLKNDPTETLAAGPEIIPQPPPGFRVIFLAFLLRGFSLPPHHFLRGLLFAYGIQLHDLNPNTILHIACFIMLCECFLGIEPHWALWR
jgi:hypothetical protein